MAGRVLVLGLLAATAAAAGTRVVAVGVQSYEDATISAVPYAAADATAVAGAFRRSGVPAEQIRLLTTTAAERPRRNAVLAALNAVRQQAVAGDRIVLFFAGHGMQTETGQYLLAYDTVLAQPEDTAIPLDSLHRALDGTQADEVLLLLDTCRDNPRAGGRGADATLSDGLARGLRARLQLPQRQPRMAACLLACDVGQRAWGDPESQHGIFTRCLLEGLSGAAAGDDGEVWLSELAGYVIQEVRAWSTRHRQAQTPVLMSEGVDDMLVAAVPAPGSPRPVAGGPMGRPGEVGEAVQPAAVAALVGNPNIATIQLRCTNDQMTTAATTALTQWVEEGGRLVLETDAAEAFGFTVAALGFISRGPVIRSVYPESHPLISGVTNLVFAPDVGATPVFCSGHPAGRALILADDSLYRRAYLVTAPLGQGELVFRAAGRLADGNDSARFADNWRRYLRGEPPAPSEPAPVERSPFVISGDALADYLADPNVASVRLGCTLDQLATGQRAALRSWVEAGGRAIVYNDVATLFGLRLEEAWNANGLYVAALPLDAHPLLREAAAVEVRFDQPPNWTLGIAAASQTKVYLCTGGPDAVALLVDDKTKRRAFLAVSRYGQGEVVFKSKVVLQDGRDRAAFDRNWAEYPNQPVGG